jgi:hypothetical protein
MSQKSCLEFLVALRDNQALLARYGGRDLPQLLFHARNEGFDFTAGDVADVVGALEANVIVAKDEESFSGSSRLWRQMWGRTHLDYVIEHVVRRHSDAELWAVLDAGRPAEQR